MEEIRNYYEGKYLDFVRGSKSVNDRHSPSAFHFKQFAEDLQKLERSFINEIIENCEVLSSGDRQFYINKLINRIKILDGGFYVIDIGEINQSKENIITTLTSLLKKKQPARDKQYTSNLRDACKGDNEYESVKAWFIQQGLYDPDTMYWKGDSKRGRVTSLIAYLKDLEQKKYSKHLKNEEIELIGKNSFMCEMKQVTIKKTKITYIPKANRIPRYNIP